jgi:hypothetical protein
MAAKMKSGGSRKSQRGMTRTSRHPPSGAPLFRIQIVDAKTPEAPLKLVKSDKLDKFRAQFQSFRRDELDKWIPKDYTLDEVSFSIEVSGAPFGVGVNGSVGVFITKKK